MNGRRTISTPCCSRYGKYCSTRSRLDGRLGRIGNDEQRFHGWHLLNVMTVHVVARPDPAPRTPGDRALQPLLKAVRPARSRAGAEPCSMSASECITSPARGGPNVGSMLVPEDRVQRRDEVEQRVALRRRRR